MIHELKDMDGELRRVNGAKGAPLGNIKDVAESIETTLESRERILACLSETVPTTEREVVDRCAGWFPDGLYSELTVGKTLDDLARRGRVRKCSVKDKAGYWQTGYLLQDQTRYFRER